MSPTRGLPPRTTRALVALSAALMSGVVLVACTNNSANPEKTTHIARSVETEATSFSVAIPAGRLTLIAGASGKVLLQGTLTYRGSQVPTSRWSNGRSGLGLSPTCPHADSDCRYDYALTVPQSINIVVTNAAGNIDVRGLVGSVRVNANAGNVSLVRATGSISVSDGVGDVIGSEVGSADAEITDDTGNVALDFSSPPNRLRVTVSTGNVTVSLPGSVGYHVALSDQQGTVADGLPNDGAADRQVSLHVGTGNISVNGS